MEHKTEPASSGHSLFFLDATLVQFLPERFSYLYIPAMEMMLDQE